MKFTIAAAALGLAATAVAHSNATEPASYVTEVVTAYTTYCPVATQFTHAGQTYTITEATTLTITNCPGGCTVTKPVYTSAVTECHTCTPTAPAYTTAPVYTAPVYTSKNATTPAVKPTGTGAYTPPASSTPQIPSYTGAASKLSFGAAGLLAAAGFVAAF